MSKRIIEFSRILLLLAVMGISGAFHAPQPVTVASVASVIDDSPANYPVPELDNQLFYIQKNQNKNTVVYQANMDENGVLDEDDPVKVFWMRYEEGGHTRSLNWLERVFAYGVDSKKVKEEENKYEIAVVSYKKRKMFVQIDEYSGEPRMYTKINGQQARILSVFLMVDGSPLIPKIRFVEIFGEDFSGKPVYEKMLVSDNKVKE